MAATKRPPPPPPPLKSKPKVAYVVALYDFSAQVSLLFCFWWFFFSLLIFLLRKADGDLSFEVGDRIEIVERTSSAEDWWTGRLNGRQGVFPGKLPVLCIFPLLF